MKNLVTESDFVETYDDFLSESTCSQLISLVDEENERVSWDWKFKHGIADLADYLMEKNPDQFLSREDAQAYLDERTAQTKEPQQTNGLLSALNKPVE